MACELTVCDDAAALATQGVALLADHRATAAWAMLQRAVRHGDTSRVTLINLALAREQSGDRDGALLDLQALEHQFPDWDEPSVRIAEAHRAAGRQAEAEQAYRHALERNAGREAALLGLSALLLQRGDGASARELLLSCCGIAPHRADAWDALGLALLLTGERPLAVAAFAKAQHLAPQNLDYALHQVEAALAAGSAEALLVRLEMAADSDPLNPVLPAARGALLARLSRRSEAIDALELATALAPEARMLVALHGELLARAGRYGEADAVLRHAMELDPDNQQLRNVRATVLFLTHRHAEARTELLAAIERDGDQVVELCNLANATTCLGLQEEGTSLAGRAIALEPGAVLPRRALCNTLPYRDGITGAELLAALRDCSDRQPREDLGELINVPDPDRPLRVGLLSGSLKIHPVAWLTVAGLETLDPASFSLICLAQNDVGDHMTRRFHTLAQAWHDVDMITDRQLALLAREQGIDVLLDLGGYGDAGRMAACAYRLAPVQIKWVGMQTHSSGLAEMDWILTDRWETPPELEHVYTERPLRLPDGYVCYSPPPYAPDTVPLPALDQGHVTFGCFNNLAKVTPRVIATWADILRRVPGARLVMKAHQFSDPPTAERIRAQFVAHGVAADRIELRGPSRHRAFMGEYNQIDIVLDPFPYSGGLTTCEALWMGVPTVTMPGETFSSRHSVSHLSNAGLTDWVAADLPGYIELAVAKASELAPLAALRAGLRARVKASPLCDAPRFGRNLGDALRTAWRDWCEHAAPR